MRPKVNNDREEKNKYREVWFYFFKFLFSTRKKRKSTTRTEAGAESSKVF